MKVFSYFLPASALVLFGCAGSGESSAEESKDSSEVVQEETFDFGDLGFTSIEKHKIPDGCNYEGKVIDVNSWEDEKGLNYFIRSIGPVIEDEPADEYADPTASQSLYAYHYCEINGKFELIKETTDFEKECGFDLIISHIPTAITLTDIDGDNIGEVSFIYRKTCTSDVSSSEQKLIMLEYGEKYALRGYTEVMGDGGDYTVGEEFDHAPEGFLEHAKNLWEQNRSEYDFEL